MDERILPSHTVIPRQNSFGCSFLNNTCRRGKDLFFFFFLIVIIFKLIDCKKNQERNAGLCLRVPEPLLRIVTTYD